MTQKHLDRARLTALLVIIGGIIYFDLNLFSPQAIPNFLRVGLPRKPLNILIVGTDMTFDSVTGNPLPQLDGRTDSLLLMHVNPAKKQINVLSIPRDTLVYLPDYGAQKINAANVYGGLGLLEQAVTKLTGQKIDYYLELKPTALIKLVDQVGGVTIDVEKDMYYIDRAQNLNINLKKGRQKLSGQQAHSYIRFRHDWQGDIGRVERQQIFLKALIHELTRPANIIRAPFALKASLQEVQTNLPIAQTARLLNMARTYAIDDLKTATVSGEPTMLPAAGSVWLPDYTALSLQIKQLF